MRRRAGTIKRDLPAIRITSLFDAPVTLDAIPVVEFTLLGQDHSDQIAPAISRYRQESEVDAALDSLKVFWDEYLSHFNCRTPDPALESMVNVHNPRQCHTTLSGSRFLPTYPPGAKENGGIFLHTNPWVMIAETRCGNGDRAYQYYRQINPAAKNDEIDRYECEPYCYAQNILGDEHPQFGLGRNSWLSGTASWVYQAATQYILGIRPGYPGLIIDPCIPAAWDGFTVTRRFRGTTVHIAVSNPHHVCQGVAALHVDGARVEGETLPLFGDGAIHDVDVVLGAPPPPAGQPQ